MKLQQERGNFCWHTIVLNSRGNSHNARVSVLFVHHEKESSFVDKTIIKDILIKYMITKNNTNETKGWFIINGA